MDVFSAGTAQPKQLRQEVESVITLVEVVAPEGAYWPSLPLPVVNPAPDAPLIVRNIVGLEPVNAAITTHPYGTQDGEFHLGSSVPKRNIVITLGLNSRLGGISVDEARNLLYGHLMPKNEVTLRFTSDNRMPVQIDGIVESLIPNRFSADPEMQVSIICPKPNFRSVVTEVITGEAGLNPIDVEVPVLGNLSSPVVLWMEAGPTEYVGDIFIENRVGETDPYRFFGLNNVTLTVDGAFVMDSNTGRKRVVSQQPIQGGWEDTVSWLARIKFGSAWTILPPAVNRFRVRMPSTQVFRTWTLSYVNQFGGI